MDIHRVIILLFFMFFSLYFPSCNGFKFFVGAGGEDLWVIRPSRNIHINDSLYFAYNKSENSVLQVTKQDYYHCNTTSPILKKADGYSEFKLGRAGPFYFISGVKAQCEKAQKLLVVVLPEHRRRYQAPSPAPFKSPTLGLDEPSTGIAYDYGQDSNDSDHSDDESSTFYSKIARICLWTGIGIIAFVTVVSCCRKYWLFEHP